MDEFPSSLTPRKWGHPSFSLGRIICLDALGSFAMIPIGEALGGILTDRVGPAFVFLVFGLFNLVNVFIPLLVREVRQLA